MRRSSVCASTSSTTPAVATIAPSGLKAMAFTRPPQSRSGSRRRPVGTSHIRAPPSRLPAAKVRPSGLNASTSTGPGAGSGSVRGLPELASQSRAVPSAAPVAMSVPSGLNAALIFGLARRKTRFGGECRKSTSVGFPSGIRKTRASAPETVRKVCPSGLNETAVTSAGCDSGGSTAAPRCRIPETHLAGRSLVVAGAGQESPAVRAECDGPHRIRVRKRLADGAAARHVPEPGNPVHAASRGRASVRAECDGPDPALVTERRPLSHEMGLPGGQVAPGNLL